MDRRLQRYTEAELKYLREAGQEFAREFPNVGGRLALDVVPCPDPYVERLLEGFAFLAARVHLKFDSEFPRFTQSLLDTVYPHYLCPTPSMVVVQVEPDPLDPALADGVPLPRQTPLRGAAGRGEQTRCEYRTAHDLTLWPLAIADAHYYTRDIAALDLPPSLGAKAAICLRLKTLNGSPIAGVKADRLPVFLGGSGEVRMRLYEAVLAHATAVVVQSPARPAKFRHVHAGTRLEPAVRPVGFSDAEALLPVGSRSFQGYRLLQEYFALPDRFLFFELTGLAKGFAQCGAADEVEVVVALKDRDLLLEDAVGRDAFALHCTPAINLFPKRCDRIHFSDRQHEFHVVPDRTRVKDFEVYQVTKVTGHGVRTDQDREFGPFYAARDAFADSTRGYFTTHRVPRTISEREQRVGGRTNYAGSDVYLTLVDGQGLPLRSELKQLSVETLCTNRDLPRLGGGTEFAIESGVAAKSVRSRSGAATPPRPSPTQGDGDREGDVSWRAVSHLSLNYLSLCDSDGREGATALRDLLRLYGDATQKHVPRQIEGVRSVSAKPITRRVTQTGPIAFARGLEVTVTFDETLYDGGGAFLLGAVLDHFFSKYVAINSFTETVVRGQERGEVMRWPARIGKRHLV